MLASQVTPVAASQHFKISIKSLLTSPKLYTVELRLRLKITTKIASKVARVNGPKKNYATIPGS